MKTFLFVLDELPQTSQPVEEKVKSPKVYNIGLYETKETQYETPSKSSTPKYEFSDSYEKISFSLTISSDSTDVESKSNLISKSELSMKKKSYVSKPENQAVLKQLRDKMEQKYPEKNKEYNIYEHLPAKTDDDLNVPDFIGGLMEHHTETLQKVIPMIRQSVRRGTSFTAMGTVESKLKTPQESITTKKQFEHDSKAELRIPPEGTELKLETTLDQKQFEAKQSSAAALSSGSATKTPKGTTSEQKRSVPSRTLFEPLKQRLEKQKNIAKPTYSTSKDEHIRKQAEIIMAQKLDSEQSGMVVTEDPLAQPETHSFEKKFVNDIAKTASNIVNQEDSLSEDSSKQKFTVLSVHIHGDSPPLGVPPKYINALKVAKNGRYKDEAHLFCENYFQNIPCYSSREKMKKNSFKENFLESSNSETITSKMLSKGEVNCHCSVSSGELHICKENNVVEKKQKNVITSRKKKPSVYSKRTYFNNWITYYVKNEPVINDSSWSSSNK